MLVQFPRQPPGGVGAAAWGAREAPGGRPQPLAVPCSPTTWSWELAVGSGLAAGGWGWMVGLVWGFSLPGGPSWLCAEQTFRPDVGNMRNQFSGNSAAKPSTFGRETGSLSVLGAQCLPLANQRGEVSSWWGQGQLGFGGRGRNTESEASSELISTGLGTYSLGLNYPFSVFMKHLLCAQHHTAFLFVLYPRVRGSLGDDAEFATRQGDSRPWGLCRSPPSWPLWGYSRGVGR